MSDVVVPTFTACIIGRHWAIWQHHVPRRPAATSHPTTIVALHIECHHNNVLVRSLGLAKRKHSTYSPAHSLQRARGLDDKSLEPYDIRHHPAGGAVDPSTTQLWRTSFSTRYGTSRKGKLFVAISSSRNPNESDLWRLGF